MCVCADIFCRRWDNSREEARSHITYTCPFPLDSDKADKFLDDPDLARYVVPYSVSGWKGKGASSEEGEETPDPDPGMVTPATIRELQKKPHFEKVIFCSACAISRGAPLYPPYLPEQRPLPASSVLTPSPPLIS